MKSKITEEIEELLFYAHNKIGLFGCKEVTIGWYGKERVDYMSYDTNDIFKCYEIKISKEDFYSKCKNTFLGNYNYYVLTKEVFDKVSDNIPDYVGVYLLENHKLISVKKAKKRNVKDKDLLKNSLIRSLAREANKNIEKMYQSKFYEKRIDRIDEVKIITEKINIIQNNIKDNDERIQYKKEKNRNIEVLERFQDDLKKELNKLIKKRKKIISEIEKDLKYIT